MCSLALPDSFEYLCYRSTAIRNMCTLSPEGSSLVDRICRRQILSTKVDPRAVRVKHQMLFKNNYDTKPVNVSPCLPPWYDECLSCLPGATS